MNLKFNPNDARLSFKLFVTLWVPVIVIVFPDLLPTTLSAVTLMAALTGTVDGIFRIFGVKEGVTEVTTETKVDD